MFDLLKEQKHYYYSPKCAVMKTEVELSGLLVWWNGIRVDPIKGNAIEDWTKPKSLTELRGVFSLLQFFRKFIKGY